MTTYTTKVSRLTTLLAVGAACLALALPAAAAVPASVVHGPQIAVPGAGANVAIVNFAFQPSDLTVGVGDTITWTNNDRVRHTTTSDTGVWNSGALAARAGTVPEGGAFSFTFNQPGRYPYHCAIHPSRMRASVTVLDGPIAPARFVARASLSGEGQVPPVLDSEASGIAVFKLRSDGTVLHYQLSVTQIGNVSEAHIHLAGERDTGPVVVSLFNPSACRQGKHGIRCEGNISAADLVGPLSGQPLGFLLGAMNAGHAYVNVHTAAYPDGEVRGQIEPIGVFPLQE